MIVYVSHGCIYDVNEENSIHGYNCYVNEENSIHGYYCYVNEENSISGNWIECQIPILSPGI